MPRAHRRPLRSRDDGTRNILHADNLPEAVRTASMTLIYDTKDLLVYEEQCDQRSLVLSAEDLGKFDDMALRLVRMLRLLGRYMSKLREQPGARLRTVDALLRFQNSKTAMALLKLIAWGARRKVLTAVEAGADQRQPADSSSLRQMDAVYSTACLLARELVGYEEGNVDLHSAALEAFVMNMLRMQTLQACARQLAAAVKELEALGVGVGAGFRRRAEAALGRAANLLDALGEHKRAAVAAIKNGKPAGPFLRELAKALRDSCLLEHATQLLLRLPMLATEVAGSEATTDEGEHDEEDEEERKQENKEEGGPYIPVDPYTGRRLGPQFVGTFDTLTEVSFDITSSLTPSCDPATAAVRDQLREVVSSPCITHVAIVGGLAVLTVADSGTAYGLPQELLACFRPAGHCSCCRNSMAHCRPLMVTRDPLDSMLYAVYGGAKAGCMSLRHAQVLLLRLSRLAVASAQARLVPSSKEKEVKAEGKESAASREGGSQGDGRRQQQHHQQEGPDAGAAATAPAAEAGGAGAMMPTEADGVAAPAAGAGAWEPEGGWNVLLEPADGVDMAVGVLAGMWDLLEEHPDIWALGAARWWRLVVSLCTACPTSDKVSVDQFKRLGKLLVQPLPYIYIDLADMSAGAPPDLEEVLDAGLLPCLESLARRSMREPLGLHRSILSGTTELVLKRNDGVVDTLGPLLAYGEPRQAAALVVSIGKVLRHIDGNLALGLAFNWIPFTSLFLGRMRSWLLAVAEEESSGGGAAAGAGWAPWAAADERLTRMVSYAVTEWLPVLSRILQKLADPEPDSVLQHVTEWLPLLLVCAGGAASSECCVGSCAGAAGAAAARPGLAAGDREPSTAASAASCGGWQGDAGCSSSGTSGGIGGQVSHSSSSSASSSSSSGSWRALLEEVNAVSVLGAEMQGLHKRRPEMDKESTPAAWGKVLDAALAFAAAFPEQLRAATVKAAVAARCAAAAKAGSKAGSKAGEGRKGVNDRQKEGAAAGAEDMAAVLDRLPWPPKSLRHGASQLLGAGLEVKKAGVEALASQLEAWASGGGAADGALMGAVRAGAAPVNEKVAAAARLLAPPGAARRFIGSCANPGCTRLEGDSELGGVRLQGCQRCRAVGYCCRECQVAHWKAGHKAECAERCSG